MTVQHLEGCRSNTVITIQADGNTGKTVQYLCGLRRSKRLCGRRGNTGIQVILKATLV